MEAARAAICLLKNEDDLLPLNPDSISSIAVVGPNSNIPRFGDYSGPGVASSIVTVLEGIKKLLPKSKVVHRWGTGIQHVNELQVIRPSYFTLIHNSSSGVLSEFFNNTNLSGSPSLIRTDPDINFNWYHYGPDPNTISSQNFSARWTAKLTSEITVSGIIGVLNTGDIYKVYVDNQLILASPKLSAPFNFIANRAYVIRVEYITNQGKKGDNVLLF